MLGSVWNTPTIDDYRGNTYGFGGEYGFGVISVGVNYFVSLKANDDGLYPRGVTFGWTFGLPRKNFEVSTTLTHASKPFFVH
jgi:hypothetical protein